MVKRFISYYKPYKKLFFLDMLVAFIAAACDLVYPMMTRTLVNDSIPNKNIRMLIVFAIMLIIIYLIKAACGYFMQYYGHVMGVHMQGDMRKDMFLHLQKLPNTYFDNNKTGDLMSRMINDLMEVSELAHHGPEDLFISVVMLLGSFVVLCTINIPLTLIIFAFIPFIVLFTWRQKNKMLNAFMETRVETSAVNSNLENSLSGIRITKAFVSHEYEIKKFKKGNKKFKNARSRAYKVMAEYSAGVGFGIDILDYISLIAGGIFTYFNYINLGDFFAYLLYIKLFTQPIKKLVSFMEQYQNGMTGFKRFISIIDEDIEEDGNIELKNVKGDIEFKDVHFSYDEKNILEGINLKIEAGKMLALVGPSGGGKTTFCNLIPRFYDVSSGDITIDNKSIYKITLESLRGNIGIVQQDVFLFTGTIKENILYGKHDATDEEVIIAAKRANIHEFIINLPDGYDTYIGERGVKLSGGQKQRISIARVFLKNPPILILDEATSALDNTTEYMIQKSLEELSKGRTTIVVAHRLSTIKNADEILVLTDKGIEEKGSHEELLENGGLYKELYESQFLNLKK
ncbi:MULTISPECIES: ABC transporter ATP-binding protein [unclassified Clostridium]|jgi:ABC transporter|uniref:ABC transporter ATP-binding protein n=1 Tax=unclassified Clostridium TaxID=2614128 RepID=UPI0025BB0D3D|nr:ABC transporter ATP-binding protein [Clostridium sp.]MCI6692376.1 ABC transporter ATP-binding protein/permease [Clostridium sp.]MDY2631322.1 ABC transporter ATP-binding protein [Clostridium sp.]MDY4252464.1 ABC transporter ATP-binding protein [Clostridium sp.]MDY6226891.1 ABC transporter ATP-binding protein [Clostridium sp.]